MDVRHLEYFVEVARHRSFTKASQVLHISQPSISKTIRILEDELGVTLFHRSAKQIELTDAGKAVLVQAQQILASFQNLTSELSDVMNIKKGNIRIGIPPNAGSSPFPRLIGEFNKAYPQITIHLVEIGSKKIEQGINEGTLDIGVVCTIPEKNQTLSMFSFVKEPLMLIVPGKHRLSTKQVVDYSELKDESFVFYREDFSLYDRIIERCHLCGFKPKIICQSSQWDFMTEMVASQLGIALLPKRICEKVDTDQVIVLPLRDPQIYWNLTVIWNKYRYLSHAARQWLLFTSSILDIDTESQLIKIGI
ncbi:LysR family transcriptional regulator [Heliobacillus mobilis]|uniref:LysR family transcriptional regulator n=1 Tax=Heliobacterium mobile TaxID=28064 RepID=A0A6I3SRE2_HELMO|nr:LysR family transcriptional regulator [Heliobacterium mobile]MTV50942.1 LysR family transcriptional regulator [Heliobacterium mobile]